MHKRASIHDVAERAGVSIKTVSRVLNREPNVSQATRSRVMQAVEELSYRPNIFARGLASVRSFLIGLIYDNPSAGYVAGLQLGALARCRAEGYHLIVEMVDRSDPDIAEKVQSLVMESQLHGVILTPPLCDSLPIIEALQAADARFVRIAPERQLPDAPQVGIDDSQAAYDMTAYLVSLGHRRIGFIKGHPDHGAAVARFEGYCRALKAAGISVEENLCEQGFFSYQSGMECAERLLSLPKRPSAIFASNDDMAAAVLATSQRFQLRAPGDLSVAGFDDSLVSQIVFPRLTTCQQPLADMAATAVSMLIQRPGEGAPTVRQLEHKLIIRESTAPPGAE